MRPSERPAGSAAAVKQILPINALHPTADADLSFGWEGNLFSHINLALRTIVIGHATFCVVIVYNNVLARLRRSSPSLLEASADLGADGWQTFRFVIWPVLSTALVAGGLLAFALSFDEVVVTYFTAGAQNTLPLLILGYIRLGQQLPVVNAIAFVMILLTVIPVALAQRLMRDTGVVRQGTAK